MVSYFPMRVCNGLEDLVEKIMNPANCLSSKVTMSVKDDSHFVTPEPVYYQTKFVWGFLLETTDFLAHFIGYRIP